MGKKVPPRCEKFASRDPRALSGARASILVVEYDARIALDIKQILAEVGFDIVGPASTAARPLTL